MKNCLSPDDFQELNETQKSALQKLWKPNKYDLAFEIVWRDVENDIYDTTIVVILHARVINTPRNYEVILKVYYPNGIPQYECPEGSSEDDNDSGWNSEMENSDDFEEQPENEDLGNKLGMLEKTELSEEHDLNKENCLPLLNIGQMIDILREHQGELSISLTPDEAICYLDGREFSGEELCDALWEAVQTLL